LIAAALAMFAGGAAGAFFLRRAWRAPVDVGGVDRAIGWVLIVASLVWPAFVIGEARGPFQAMALLSVGALALVATGAKLKPARAGRSGRKSLAPEPSERSSTAWRGVLRWLLAGPIGMIAAMALGIAWATYIPGEPQTRLLIGGLIVPVAWGAAMAWTLADDRILRATAVLVGTTILGFGLSILKGFA
jgi:hypothetical protein